MGKIATEKYAADLAGALTLHQDRCCTKSQAISFGLNVSGSYSNNQLVQESSLSKPSINGTIKISSSVSYNLCCLFGPSASPTGSGSQYISLMSLDGKSWSQGWTDTLTVNNSSPGSTVKVSPGQTVKIYAGNGTSLSLKKSFTLTAGTQSYTI